MTTGIQIDDTRHEVVKGLAATILIRKHQLHISRKLGPRHFDETLKLFSSETEIDIIIPWDKSLMAHSTEKGAGIDEIRDAVALTDGLHRF